MDLMLMPRQLRVCLIPMVSVFSLDARSQLRCSRNQDSVLSTDTRSVSVDNTGKTPANAAGVWRGYHRL